MIKKFGLLSAAIGAAALGVSSADAEDFKAEGPQCIAPSNPGGGWDFICRTTAKYLFDLGVIDNAMQVTNMSGGGGGVAFAHVTKERTEDNNLIVAASMSTSARIAQGIYEGAKQEDVHFRKTGANFEFLSPWHLDQWFSQDLGAAGGKALRVGTYCQLWPAQAVRGLKSSCW